MSTGIESIRHRWMIWRQRRIMLKIGRLIARLNKFPKTATQVVTEERYHA